MKSFFKIGFFVLVFVCLILIAGLVVSLVMYSKAEKKRPKVVEKALSPAESIRLFSADRSKFINELVDELKAREVELIQLKDALSSKDQELKLRAKTFDTVNEKFAGVKSQVQGLQVRVETELSAAEDIDRNNFTKLADMCAKMEPEAAYEVLKELDPDRAAIILSMLDDRPAAQVLNAAAGMGNEGAVMAAKWMEAMEKLKKNGEEGSVSPEG
ncbi:MAG: hypothetical protein EOL87_05120 [Spartobacteria bacterium]|nr:hypothetical protein [Spartobacteria bacterium]